MTVCLIASLVNFAQLASTKKESFDRNRNVVKSHHKCSKKCTYSNISKKSLFLYGSYNSGFSNI